MIYNNGIHYISNNDYHNSSGISRSGLWELKKSPWHYWKKYLDVNKDITKENYSFKLGELVHCLVLEPKEFNNRYIVQPKPLDIPKLFLLKDVGRESYDMQKLYREQIIESNKLLEDDFFISVGEREIISQDIYQEAIEMADSAMSNTIAPSLFTDCDHIEASIFFTHKLTGLQCKVRPDAWKNNVVTDLKTVKDGEYNAFQKSCVNYGYFLQAAMIKQALDSLGEQLDQFIFYCIEKSPGYPCVFYMVDDEAMNYGTNQFNELMFEYSQCITSNAWPVYDSKILTVPSYLKGEKNV